MDRTLLALLIGIACALIFGFFIARRSIREKKIYGGVWAKVFHYIGAAGVGGILPLVLASLLLGLGFRTAFPLALSFLIVAWVALMLYAVIERRALAGIKVEAQGWTREDAKKSY